MSMPASQVAWARADALRTAIVGRPAASPLLVHVAGPSGSGKSMLFERLAMHLQHARCLDARRFGALGALGGHTLAREASRVTEH